jgi:hypothetical protein
MAWLKKIEWSAALTTEKKYVVAPETAPHWKVTLVPLTVAPSAGELSVGAEGTDVVPL